MTTARALAGLSGHFLTTLRLNFRSRQALVYGYVVPVFFLFAFGSVFRGETPALFHQMGQLITITILGGACFGLPTAIVGERERGVWRRYRLLPVSTTGLLLSALAGRLLIVLSAVLFQVALARLCFGTPWPTHVGETLAAVMVVAGAFLGLGLLVAALARDVPAVQALGQCLFLPMIMIGGVGVPLAVLPDWAQRVSGFMPGRYAVDLLQAGYSGPPGFSEKGFSLVALGVIGLSAGAIGAKLFRWDPERRLARRDAGWVALALSAWIAVGSAAAWTGRLEPMDRLLRLDEITDEHVQTIAFDDLTGDDELVTRLAPPFNTIEDRFRVLPLGQQIAAWPPANVSDAAQRVRHVLCLAALADLHADLREADIGRVVFDHLRSQHSHAELRRLLTWIILTPEAGEIITTAPEFGLKRTFQPKAVRLRSTWYAKKYLGRLVGKLREPEPAP